MYEAEKRIRRYERLYGQRVLKPIFTAALKVAPDPHAGGVWLDWEAGPGVISAELAGLLPRDATLLASEQDRAALRVFHTHGQLEDDPRVFVRQDLPEDLALAGGVVDVALGHWRWQYTTKLESLRELARVVKPGGKLVLTFLMPGSGGTLLDALIRARADHVAAALTEDGLTSSVIRENLRASRRIQQVEVRSLPMQITVGQSSRPMMDPLMLDFLLPRWLGRATGEEISVVENAPFDLGPEPLVWDFKVGVATATITPPVLEEYGETERTPLPR